MNTGGTIAATMRAIVYPPPSEGYPHIAIVFHTDGTVLLARLFDTAEGAHQYMLDVSSSLVSAASNYSDLPASLDHTASDGAVHLPDSSLSE